MPNNAIDGYSPNSESKPSIGPNRTNGFGFGKGFPHSFLLACGFQVPLFYFTKKNIRMIQL